MRKDRVVAEVFGEETPITPSDLYNKEFRSSLVGGYDKNEVDLFLERVGDAFESLTKRVRELKDSAEEQKSEIVSLREMESSLRDALVAAQKYSEDVIDTARREASALMGEARLAKSQAQVDAAEQKDALREEILALKEARERLRSDLAAILDTHRSLVTEIPAAEDRVPEPSLERARSTDPGGFDHGSEPLALEPWPPEPEEEDA